MFLKDYIDKLIQEVPERNARFGLSWLKDSETGEFFSEIVIAGVDPETQQLSYYYEQGNLTSVWGYTNDWRIIGFERRKVKHDANSRIKVPTLFLKICRSTQFPYTFDQRRVPGKFFYDHGSTEIRRSR